MNKRKKPSATRCGSIASFFSKKTRVGICQQRILEVTNNFSLVSQIQYGVVLCRWVWINQHTDCWLFRLFWSDFYRLNRLRGWGLYRLWAWHPQKFCGALRATSLQIPPSNNPRSATATVVIHASFDIMYYIPANTIAISPYLGTKT